MIKSSTEIIEAARKLSASGMRRVVVGVAQDADVIEAVKSAREDGICDGSLVGDGQKIRKLAEKNSISLDGLELINQPDPNQAVMQAVQLAAEGKADVVMKGFVSTSGLLRGVLDRRFNLRASPTLSHVAVLDIPGYHKLLMLTDGGMVVKPTIEQRLDILKNAVIVGKALGIETVKVALSAACDTVAESMPQTKEDARIPKLVRQEKIGGCEIAGPMSFDVATSAEVAQKAGIDNPVAGDADVYLVGSIEECNITAKTMIVFAEAIFAGVIVGAKIPVSVVSRTDPVFGKKTSIALACLVADYYRRTGKEV
jgi:phosphate butyryltransferase